MQGSPTTTPSRRQNSHSRPYMSHRSFAAKADAHARQNPDASFASRWLDAHPPSENRVWHFFGETQSRTSVSWSQVVEPHREIDPHAPTTALDVEYTALYYYGFRFYSPELGRWPSRDPIGEAGLRAMRGRAIGIVEHAALQLYSLYLYHYVWNAPSLYVDAVGLVEVALPEYRTDPTLCAAAMDKGWDHNAGGGGDAAGFICVGGESYMCMWQEFDDASPKGIRSCLERHERLHWLNGDIKDCKKCEDGRAPFPDDYDADDAECEAYLMGVACLFRSMTTECGKLSGDAKKSCQKEYCAYIGPHADMMVNKCRPGFPAGRKGWKSIHSACGRTTIPTY